VNFPWQCVNWVINFACVYKADSSAAETQWCSSGFEDDREVVLTRWLVKAELICYLVKKQMSIKVNGTAQNKSDLKSY